MFINSVLKMTKQNKSIEVCMILLRVLTYIRIFDFFKTNVKSQVLNHNWVQRQTRAQVVTVFKHSAHFSLNYIGKTMKKKGILWNYEHFQKYIKQNLF